ncbi:cell envelope biogenesis protein TolA [Bartonella doshiae]|uniref:cell envelope biogenesis protein TolA n=1 Tax=Bartonella doshiae TaxID=33044 RepID=UPI000945A9D1|nr:cell envelope biogenesis protein TolA [Bartonella doshiae]
MNKNASHSMKRSLALSFIAHLILLSFGIIHFTNPVSLPQQQLEALSITLAPLSQELSSQKGALNAPVREVSAVKPTTKPQKKEEAQHFGEGQVDVLAPLKPKEKPRDIDTTPIPSGKESASEKPSSVKEQELPETKAEEAPKEPVSEPQEVAPEVMPKEPVSEPQEVAPEVMPKEPVSEPQEVAPEIMPKVSALEPQEGALGGLSEKILETSKNQENTLPNESTKTTQKALVERAQAPKITLPSTSPLPQFKPKSANDKKSLPQNAQAAKHKTQQTNVQTIEDILAMEEKNLLNYTRTQGGGAKRSSEPEALGARKNMGNTIKIAQTLVNIVGSCIQKKLKLVALGGDLKNRPAVRLRFYLNYEGMVVGEPVIDPLSGGESQQAIMVRQVYAAVFSCQPYPGLPRDQYDMWEQGFDFNVDPFKDITR